MILGFGYGGRWLILNGGRFAVVVVVVGGGGVFRSVGLGCGGGGSRGWLCGFCICFFFLLSFFRLF